MAPSGSVPVAIPAEVAAVLRRHDLFRALVKKEVVAQAVSHVAISPEETQQLFQGYCQRFELSNEQELGEHLVQRGLSKEDLSWQLQLPLRLQRHSREAFGAKAEQHFLQRKNSLDQVVYSLLRVEDAFLARELYLQIAEGESDFAELAGQYAEGPERTTRGIVGPVPLTQAHPTLADRMRTSTPGTLLEPFQIEKWWLVVRLERYMAASFDEAMLNRMCGELFEQWIQEEVTDRMRSFKEKDLAATPV